MSVPISTPSKHSNQSNEIISREQTTAKLLARLRDKDSLLYLEPLNRPINRLKSRHPIWSDFLLLDHYNIKQKWFTGKILNCELIDDLTILVGGFDLEHCERDV